MAKRLFFTDYVGYVNERLSEILDNDKIEPKLKEAMLYSIDAGGKRIRPVLCLLSNSLFDGDMDEAMDMACAVELIHTYSLIHDDLPALDNDKIRRGKPTNHIVNGEAFAILAGDGLLNLSYEVMINNAIKYPQNSEKHMKAIAYLAKAAGVTGMVSGQVADILHENDDESEIDIDIVDKIHVNKTGKLITAGLVTGAILSGAKDSDVKKIEKFGKKIGLAFQVVDDILDVTGDESDIGKSIGKDADAGKMTYPHVYGLKNSVKIVDELTNEAKEILSEYGDKAKDLILLADYFAKRVN